ncbi:hypothetical protein [Streptomyces sp. V4I2]|uniref:hypothetical protein n=1 Tax=Streptomyces sp. V4I2 TaxID=3042280 RepID=UPI00278A7F05|nr:hypothetical protein [Streptomyces sp. V4I2]MDQ1047234.1 hypothetical protein [Streptomyces sp. V4I2]
MQRIRQLGVVLTAAASLLGLGLATSSTAQAAPTGTQDYAGCVTGRVCIYPNAGWNNNNPEHWYYTYGVHQLYDEYGVHRVFNNQTGNATARLCVNRDGTNCTSKIPPYTYSDIDLTPYNSIRLDPS